MAQCQTLHAQQLITTLRQAVADKAQATISFFTGGKWHIVNLMLAELVDDTIVLSDAAKDVCIYQPVNVCIPLGHHKLLFDSQVVKPVNPDEHRLCIDYPDTAELMQRRAYIRQPVPESLNVKVLFWHRGFLDGSQPPAEQYWQGRLLNLSAGGAQFEISNDQKQYFSASQLLGVQFTPMSFEKPFLLETHVKYLRDIPETGHFRIGVEFLGLETTEGRQTLHRLLDIIRKYGQMNLPAQNKSAS